MIVRSRWRRTGGLAAHLLRVDNNETVRVRDDVGRDAPGDVHQAVSLFAAIARTNARTSRDVIHIKVSPTAEMTDDQLNEVIVCIEREHGIANSMPRLVVQHAKGDRATHFHVVYPLVDPKTGHAVPSQGNYFRDEMVSSIAEIALGEKIVPGPRQNGVVIEMRARGRVQEADLLATYAPVWVGNRLTEDVRQQTGQLAIDACQIATHGFDMWRKADGSFDVFVRGCEDLGYIVALGERAHLLVHKATGVYVPLARALRQQAKKVGATLNLRERDLDAAFPSAKPFGQTRDAALDKEVSNAKAAVDLELERLQEEARRDGQRQLAERLLLVRERETSERKKKQKKTLAGRRAEIRALYARRDRVRRARVNRAFIFARIMDRRQLRVLLFEIAGLGVLLAGGGLGAALVIAGFAVAILPTRERARTMSFEARLQRKDDRDAATLASRKAYDAIAAKHSNGSKLDFGLIDKRHRAVSGAFCHIVLDEADGRMTADQVVLKLAFQQVLGDRASMLENAVLHGAGRGALSVLAWYDPGQLRHRQAVAATLRQAGNTGASLLLMPRTTAQAKRATRGRE